MLKDANDSLNFQRSCGDQLITRDPHSVLLEWQLSLPSRQWKSVPVLPLWQQNLAALGGSPLPRPRQSSCIQGRWRQLHFTADSQQSSAWSRFGSCCHGLAWPHAWASKSPGDLGLCCPKKESKGGSRPASVWSGASTGNLSSSDASATIRAPCGGGAQYGKLLFLDETVDRQLKRHMVKIQIQQYQRRFWPPTRSS